MDNLRHFLSIREFSLIYENQVTEREQKERERERERERQIESYSIGVMIIKLIKDVWIQVIPGAPAPLPEPLTPPETHSEL